jgi:hypothetical protein
LGAIRAEGWDLSHRSGRPVDRTGAPVPWYTYPCRDFLERRLRSSFRVFEYGSGNSTLWYAGRVGNVTSVEHDADWAREVSARAPDNVTIISEPPGPGYASSIGGRGPFEIVVVDGLQRPECADAAIDELSGDGVLVWDNSDWEEFREKLPSLKDRGFKELDLTGIGPINRDKWTTSILYRAGNCLDL